MFWIVRPALSTSATRVKCAETQKYAPMTVCLVMLLCVSPALEGAHTFERKPGFLGSHKAVRAVVHGVLGHKDIGSSCGRLESIVVQGLEHGLSTKDKIYT
jgi:hypothetical protein